MKLRTEEELLDFLDHEMGWRIREISEVKTVVRQKTELARRALIRAGVPLVYAHWEGFVKNSAEGFLCFVAHQNKSYRDLAPCFTLNGFDRVVESLESTNKQHQRVESMRFLLNDLDKRARISWEGKIRTANLNSDVFQSIAATVGVSVERYKSRFNMVDEQLLKSRNKIAHGEYLHLDDGAFLKLVSETLNLMRWFKTDLENATVQRSYLSKP